MVEPWPPVRRSDPHCGLGRGMDSKLNIMVYISALNTPTKQCHGSCRVIESWIESIPLFVHIRDQAILRGRGQPLPSGIPTKDAFERFFPTEAWRTSLFVKAICTATMLADRTTVAKKLVAQQSFPQMDDDLFPNEQLSQIGCPIFFTSGQFSDCTIRMELDEVQKAELGRKWVSWEHAKPAYWLGWLDMQG